MESRVYRLSWQRRLLSLSMAIAAVAFGVMVYRRVTVQGRSPELWEVLLPIVSILLTGLYAVLVFSTAITLTGERIEQGTLLGRRVLPLAAIRGRRKYAKTGGWQAPDDAWQYRIESRDAAYAALDFECGYAFDAAFYTWFERLPDLDAEESAAVGARRPGIA
jgi:hypothetical protein